MSYVRVELQVDLELTEKQQQALQWIEKVFTSASQVEQLPPVEVSVTIVDNETIHNMNQEYRQVDRPTDVLSFPLWEPDEEWIVSEEEPEVPLGDIVISLPKAEEQAAEYGHSLDREIGFLATHGFLHLLGYDHETPEEETEMFAKQEEILKQTGLQR
ncbi:rRNA maturation RNase YbeY [Hazenella coriacea]|uniref:Endoribonuclease YbeY n=1 Tax=Hazenella coriacea TaxID=1179467 RepID=A0A4R3L6Q1_9BACL|nr:rRNA maturation RNase YbeY [Hazenella coriacea]TCS94758.1 putative rRNA maturation factor [Hazenella coriacea]